MNVLKDIALFVEVCKTMNFRRAAEALNMPSSTLSRRISHLEKEIGLRLLHRTTRKVELTEAGQLYYQRCKRIVNEAQLAHEQLGEMLAQPSGIIKASVPVDFATIYLAPLLTQFTTLYPKINFELDVTPRQVNLISEHVDLAIRIGQQKDSNLITRKITQLTAKLFASPAYLKKNNYPQHTTELIQHSCIGFPKHNYWALLKGEEEVKVECNGRFKVNNIGMMKRLATLDQGIILIPEDAISNELAQESLVPVLPKWHSKPSPIYALTETRLLPAKVRVFIDFLQENLNKPL